MLVNTDFVIFLFCAWSKIVISDINERHLYEHLLEHYNILERPVNDATNAVDVRLAVILQQIIEVDEQKQTIQINAWMKFTWNDYMLKWDPNEYGNIRDIRLPVDKLWKPDVLLYNSVDGNFGSTYPTNAIISNTGEVHWIPPGILKSSCSIRIRYFPFDEQTCFFKFGSWTYDGFKLNLTTEKGDFDTSEYVENGEWFLTNATETRDVQYYSCCPEPYIDLKFTLHIKRRSLYYAFNLIVPSLLISFMSLMGFLLPVESNQKITLQIAVLLSLCIFTSLVAQATPPTSESLPLLGVFFICNMIAVAVSVVLNVVVINLYYQESRPLPKCVREIFLNFLPTLLLMKKLKTTKRQIKDNPDDLDPSVVQPLLQRENYASAPPMYPNIATTDYRTLDPTLLRILNILRQYKNCSNQIDEENNARRDWKYVSSVVDRLCLIFFSLVFFISTFAILFSRS